MITIEKIAKEAGVSKVTVSNVLNRRIKEVWPSTIERASRIRQIAKRLGYRPNLAARAVSTGRFHSVALLQTTKVGAGVLSHSLIDGIHDALAKREMHLTVALATDEQLNDRGFVPNILRQFMADALLINYRTGEPEHFVHLLERQHSPWIWINVKWPTDAVYYDEISATRRATEHLLNLGHRRIAYVDYRFGPNPKPTSGYAVFDRREGYRGAMEQAGLQPWFIFDPNSKLPDEGWLDSETWIDESRRWLSRPDRPTAVVAFKTSIAMPIYIGAVGLGLRVPGDLSIICMDSPQDKLGIRMGTMWMPEHEIGSAAVRMVLHKLDDPSAGPCPSLALPAQFDPGQTVGPPG